MVRVRAAGTVAGTAQATLPAGGPVAGPAEVAWVVVRPAQGRGYGKEAARSLVALLQNRPGNRRDRGDRRPHHRRCHPRAVHQSQDAEPAANMIASAVRIRSPAPDKRRNANA